MDVSGVLIAEDCRYEEGEKALTSQVTAQHQVYHKETVRVVLKGISQIHDEWVIDLAQECLPSVSVNPSLRCLNLCAPLREVAVLE